MLVGLDSIVDITELHVVPGEAHPAYMELTYKYKIAHYGAMDQNFNTDLGAAIINRLQAVLQEGIESEE